MKPPSARARLSPKQAGTSAVFLCREARGGIMVGKQITDFDTVSSHVRKLSEHARSL